MAASRVVGAKSGRGRRREAGGDAGLGWPPGGAGGGARQVAGGDARGGGVRQGAGASFGSGASGAGLCGLLFVGERERERWWDVGWDGMDR